MASALGAQFSNGFAFDTLQLLLPKPCLNSNEVHVFGRSVNALGTHTVTAGVNSVATFTGSAFKVDGTPLMIFNSTSVSLEPEQAWSFTRGSRLSVAGWYQGAVKQVGRGRVGIFGEAAMFSEQDCGQPMGMNHPLATDNARFVRNLVRWIGRRSD